MSEPMRFFSYDPGRDIFDIHPTLEAARLAAEDTLKNEARHAAEDHGTEEHEIDEQRSEEHEIDRYEEDDGRRAAAVTRLTADSD